MQEFIKAIKQRRREARIQAFSHVFFLTLVLLGAFWFASAIRRQAEANFNNVRTTFADKSK